VYKGGEEEERGEAVSMVCCSSLSDGAGVFYSGSSTLSLYRRAIKIDHSHPIRVDNHIRMRMRVRMARSPLCDPSIEVVSSV